MTKNTSTSTPDLDTVKIAVVAAALAHKDPASEGFEKRKNDVKDALNLGEGDTLDVEPFFKYVNAQPKIAGCVIATADNIYVAYHGTKYSSKSEIGHDLQGTKSSMIFGDKETKIHTGFKTEFELSQQQMETALKNARQKHPDASVTFTGHSLGGAVSQIAALKYTTEKDESKLQIPSEKVQNLTFGAPRVFSTKAAKLYSEKLGNKTLRVTLDRDPVTGLPPASIGFRHVGKKVKIGGWGHRGGTYQKHVEKSQSIKPKQHTDYSIAGYILHVMKLTPQKFKQLLHTASKMIKKFKNRSATITQSTTKLQHRQQQRNNGPSI